MGPPEVRGQRGRLGGVVKWVHKDQLAPKEILVSKVLLGPPDLRGPRERLERLVKMGLQARMGRRGLQGSKVKRGTKELERWGSLELKGRGDWMVKWAPLGPPDFQETWVHRVKKAPLATEVSR